ncbi:MAG: hypothetical protein A2W25_16975 [candidate division Zixibacteria bacterium RBG_16_53_22]|nr:MAG: hypothetical protein A2W25_16975 [candidate division Zixibacteria bacterium RBG_16_53_22]
MRRITEILIVTIAASVGAICVVPKALANSPGDTVGFTQYDLQSLCSIGTRVAADTAGGVHFTWMKGINSNSTRNLVYDYLSPSGQWLGEVVLGRYGFPQMALMPDGRAVIVSHRANVGSESLYCAVDAAPGQGYFDFYPMPERMGTATMLWPYVTVDRSGQIQAVASSAFYIGNQSILGYNRSSDGGPSWLSWVPIDSVMMPTAAVTASPVSDKVSVIYCHPFDTTNQWSNDIYYIQSLDGTNWDWQNGKVNVTGYGNDNDSISAYLDLDAVYDYNDNLHMVWNTVIDRDPGIGSRISIFHADQISETLVEITRTDETWTNCGVGSWNLTLAKMSVSVHTSNLLVATYVRFSPADCSAGGYANGDIYLQHSPDGIVWSVPVNITNSPSPNCNPGDCDSDHWPSSAERIDNYMHLFYVNDRDAGAIPYYEGSITNNPMLYYRIPVDQLGVDEDAIVPSGFTLHQNFPNPFNTETSIEFDWPTASRARLSIYDIAGRRIATLLERHIGPGCHRVTWDATGQTSGIYFARLECEGRFRTAKLILLK